MTSDFARIARNTLEKGRDRESETELHYEVYDEVKDDIERLSQGTMTRLDSFVTQ